MRKAALYVRVSKADQAVLNQIRELEEAARRHQWEIVCVFKDEAISGAKGREQRPGLDALLQFVAEGSVEVVAAWSVDRLGRSLRDLELIHGELKEHNVDLYLHQQGLDTSTPSGKALFQMLGVFAEFELAMTRERIKSGLARTRAQGTKLGRRPIRRRVRQKICKLLAQGLPQTAIAERVGVSRATVQNVAREVGLLVGNQARDLSVAGV